MMRDIRLPGLIDPHVHLRQPGGEHKENIASGSAAALAGGVSMILDMPNTTPPTTDARSLQAKLDIVRGHALCDVGLYVGASEANALDAASLVEQAIGLKIYLNDTYGPLRMRSLAALLTHFQTWPRGRPIAVHAEGLTAATAIGLARIYGQHLHLCHVSLASEIALVRSAKESGAELTCEVTPHHLFLTEEDARRLGPYGFMKPPLAGAADREALWANLDVIDCIATDHAPHTRDEKEGRNPPPGVPGLETSLPLLLTAVAEKRLTMERLIELMHDGPRSIFGLPRQPKTWVDIDLGARYTIDSATLHTRCGWTPFEGMDVQGRAQRVVLRGEIVFEEGQIRAQLGSGHAVSPL